MHEPAQPPDPSPAPDAGLAEPPVAVPAGESAPPDWDEDLYLATSTLLVEPAAASNPWINAGCLTVSLALFVLSFFSLGVQNLALLIPVLFFHEAGHFAGMRL